MPHLSLIYSSNVDEKVEARVLFGELHQALMELEAFELLDFKSRTMMQSNYHIGDGAENRAFVHLDVAVMAGRDVSVRQRVVQVCLRVLNAYFAGSAGKVDLQLSVELREMDRATYAKQRGGATA